MNLKAEKIINETQRRPLVETQQHITVSGLEFKEGEMTAYLSDSRSVTVPTAWFKRLRKATSEQLNDYEISPAGCAIH